MVVQDSIEFTTNSNIQNIQLVAYGQDFKLIKGETLKRQPGLRKNLIWFMIMHMLTVLRS